MFSSSNSSSSPRIASLIRRCKLLNQPPERWGDVFKGGVSTSYGDFIVIATPGPFCFSSFVHFTSVKRSCSSGTCVPQTRPMRSVSDKSPNLLRDGTLYRPARACSPRQARPRPSHCTIKLSALAAMARRCLSNKKIAPIESITHSPMAIRRMGRVKPAKRSSTSAIQANGIILSRRRR